MKINKFVRIGLLSITGLFIVSLFANNIPLLAQAQTSTTWTRVFPGITSAVTDGHIATIGANKIGIAYTTSSSTAGFAISTDGGNTWTTNNDLSGASTNWDPCAIFAFSPSTWYIIFQGPSGIQDLYSTNDGSSWFVSPTTGTGAMGDGTFTSHVCGAAVVNGAIYVAGQNYINTVSGNTFGSRQCVTDNNIDPSQATCLASANCPLQMSSPDIGVYKNPGGQLAPVIVAGTVNNPGAPYISTKSDDTHFWTSIWSTNGCSSGGFDYCTHYTNNQATQCFSPGRSVGGLVFHNINANTGNAVQYEGAGVGCTNNPCGGTGETLPISGFSVMGTCSSSGATSGAKHIAVGARLPYTVTNAQDGSQAFLAAYKCTSDAFFKADYKVGLTGTPFNVLSNSGLNAQPYDVGFTTDKAWIVYSNTAVNRLELLSAKITDLAPTLISPTQIGLSNVLGFDVDSFDQNIIVRQLIPSSTHEIVQTINPGSLTLLETSNNDNTNCGNTFVGFCTAGCDSSRLDGVGTLFDGIHVYTTFYNCANDHTTNRIHIRDGALGNPSQDNVPCNDGSGNTCVSVCNGLSFCDFDLLNTANTCGGTSTEPCTLSADNCASGNENPGPPTPALPTTMRFLDKLSLALWDWSNQANPTDSSPKHATLGWTYADASGNVGTLALTQNHNNQDCYQNLNVIYSAGQPAAGMCSFNNFINGKNAVIAVGSGSSTKTYESTLDIGHRSELSFNVYYPQLTLQNTGLGTSPLSGAQNLACAPERWGVKSSDSTTCTAHGFTTTPCKFIHYNGNDALLSIGSNVYHTHVTNDNDNHQRYGVDYTITQAVSGNAVALSGDGHWGAYLSIAPTTTADGVISIINATNGNVVGSVADPHVVVSGSPIPCCIYFKMDDTGQFLYGVTGTLANTQFLYKWDIHGLTTKISVPPGNTPTYDGTGTGTPSDSICTNPIGGASPDCSSAIDTSTNNNPSGNPSPAPLSTSSSPTTGASFSGNQNDNILGINVTATAKGLNVNRVVVLILISVVLMGVFFIWIYRNTDSIIGGVFGAFMGFILSIALGLLPQWVMIAIVLILLIIFGKMLFGGFYAGSEE